MASIFGRAAVSALLLAGLTLVGCSVPADEMAPIPRANTSVYRLGPGDQVRVIVAGEQDLSGQFRIDSDGTVNVPLLGPTKATGLTAAGLAQTISTKLRTQRQYKDPSVAVEVAAYRNLAVLGEVNRPGQFAYQPAMTVVDAVADAGGFTYRAIDDRFSIARNVGGHTIKGRAERETPVQPGDVITVYERQF